MSESIFEWFLLLLTPKPMLLPSLCHFLASLETCLPLKTFFFEKMIFHFNGEHHTLENPLSLSDGLYTD